MRRLAVILGVPVDEVTLTEAVDRIEAFIRQRGALRQVATVNTDFIIQAHADPELREILRQADLVTADGMPLVWASRLLGEKLPERVTGADLVPALAERCARNGHSLYLLGARPEVAKAAAERLLAQFPSLVIRGVYSPPPAGVLGMDHEDILRRVNAAQPDALLVAFGNPKQEKWIAMHRRALRVPVAIGIGGSLDFLAGRTRRAPRWLQEKGLEWAWRLGNEPRRLWRRYTNDIARFSPMLGYHWLRLQRAAAAGSSTDTAITLQPADDGSALIVRGPLTAGARTIFESQAAEALRRSARISLDLHACSYLDSAGMGMLVQLAQDAKAAGGALRLKAVPDSIRALLRLGSLENFFAAEESAIGVIPPADAAKISSLQLRGKIDWNAVPRLREALRVAAAPKRQLFLGMNDITFLDSAALCCLLQEAKRLRAMGGDLILVQPSVAARAALRLADLEGFFKTEAQR